MTEASLQSARRILVVDDELGICDFLRAFFTRRDYDVKTVCSGQEALDAMQEFQPRIVLLDVRMPGLSGIEVLEHMRRNWPDVKVVMVTAFADDSLIEQARALGAADYLTKPFSLDYLENDVLKKLAHL